MASVIACPRGRGEASSRLDGARAVAPCRRDQRTGLTIATPGPLPAPRRTAAIWRVRDRATFAALRRQGRRAHSGPLSVTWLPGPGTQPSRVAYAIGRTVGPAVVRNRIRRRLRAVVAELAGDLRPGDYLIGVAPSAAHVSFATLRSSLQAASSRVWEQQQ